LSSSEYIRRQCGRKPREFNRGSRPATLRDRFFRSIDPEPAASLGAARTDCHLLGDKLAWVMRPDAGNGMSPNR
jgi:hypothetical protein